MAARMPALATAARRTALQRRRTTAARRTPLRRGRTARQTEGASHAGRPLAGRRRCASTRFALSPSNSRQRTAAPARTGTLPSSLGTAPSALGHLIAHNRSAALGNRRTIASTETAVVRKPSYSALAKVVRAIFVTKTPRRRRRSSRGEQSAVAVGAITPLRSKQTAPSRLRINPSLGPGEGFAAGRVGCSRRPAGRGARPVYVAAGISLVIRRRL